MTEIEDIYNQLSELQKEREQYDVPLVSLSEMIEILKATPSVEMGDKEMHPLDVQIAYSLGLCQVNNGFVSQLDNIHDYRPLPFTTSYDAALTLFPVGYDYNKLPLGSSPISVCIAALTLAHSEAPG